MEILILVGIMVGIIIGLNINTSRRYPKIPAIKEGTIVKIGDRYFKLRWYEDSSGGAMDTATRYTFEDMSLDELDEAGIKRPKNWRF